MLTEGDELDFLAMPPIAPVHTTRLEPAAPKVSQRVRDAIARSGVQQVATSHTATIFSPPPPPMPHVQGGPAAEAIARHHAVEAERSQVLREVAQVDRGRCAATARLLARVGWSDRAEAIMAAAPAPTHTVAPLVPASDRVVSLRPVAVHGEVQL